MNKRMSHNGKKYGRLLVISDADDTRSPSGKLRRMVLCECDCGNMKVLNLYKVKSGHTKSCGCFKREIITTHGLQNHRLYKIFEGMKARCYNKNKNSFVNYGGRGIKVCDEWLNNFMSFYNWCIDSGWEEGLQIDRIDNDGNYEPGNCRFVTHRENNLNKRLLTKNNTSGYQGVCFRKDRNKWISQIKINYQNINLGNFKTKKEALSARNNYIIQNNLQHEYKIQEWREE